MKIHGAGVRAVKDPYVFLIIVLVENVFSMTANFKEENNGWAG